MRDGEFFIQECSQLRKKTWSPCCAENNQKNPPNFTSEIVMFFRTEMNMDISWQIPTSYPNQKCKVDSFTLLVSLCCLTTVWVCHVKTVHCVTSPEALRSFILVFFNTVCSKHFLNFSIYCFFYSGFAFSCTSPTLASTLVPDQYVRLSGSIFVIHI